MKIVLFRSRLRPDAGDAYGAMARRTLELARAMPGFISFKQFSAPDGERLSVIEFESDEAIAAWYRHPEHLAAQQRGRDSFYEDYQIHVCSPTRSYGFTRKDPGTRA